MNPSTIIYLCDTPLNNDYKNSLTFTNANAQYNYFYSKIKYTFTNYTYQRQDNTIVVQEKLDNILKCNYLFYQNTNFNNKWFYAFITKVEYISENSCWIYIESYVYQTWLFDIVYQDSFIEREHVNDDKIGTHTVPENVEKGEYIVNRHQYDNNLLNTNIVIASSVTPTEGISLYGANYNGIYSGVRYYTYDANNVTSNLQFLADNNKIDGVTSLFLAPSFLCNNQGGSITESTEPNQYTLSWNKITTLDGYTPKNNKLLTYPYCYVNVSNANGSNAIYHQELFGNLTDNNKIDFNVYGSLTPGCSIKCVPIYYKNDISNYDEGINAGKFPQLNWATDMFTNWVTQNGVNVGTSLIKDAVTGITENPIDGILGIANSVREIQLADKIPPQVSGNLNCGDVTTSAKENTFHFYFMSIRQEYAKIIDDYFSMFGYKINRVKNPNITGRRNWNYVKTINCNFTGDIPQNDMQIIKQIFNDGITLWHNPSTFLDYSQNNDII